LQFIFSRRVSIDRSVSRLLTALNLLPSMATTAWVNNFSSRHKPTKRLHASGHLRAPVKLSRLLILGALNWSVQWFDEKKGASLDELTDAAMALFLKES